MVASGKADSKARVYCIFTLLKKTASHRILDFIVIYFDSKKLKLLYIFLFRYEDSDLY